MRSNIRNKIALFLYHFRSRREAPRTEEYPKYIEALHRDGLIGEIQGCTLSETQKFVDMHFPLEDASSLERVHNNIAVLLRTLQVQMKIDLLHNRVDDVGLERIRRMSLLFKILCPTDATLSHGMTFKDFEESFWRMNVRRAGKRGRLEKWVNKALRSEKKGLSIDQDSWPYR